MGITGLIIGAFSLLFGLFLATAIPTALSGWPQNTIDMAVISMIFLGFSALIIGAKDRKLG